MEIRAQHINDLQHQFYRTMSIHGVREQTRNGEVLRLPEPVTVILEKPWLCASLCRKRDANPFFHMAEALYMLANKNCVRDLAFFAKNIAQYSDDGKTFNAFYGERAISTWGNQIAAVILELTRHPNSRRAVIQLWHPLDLYRDTKDKACNTQIVFDIKDNRLTMYTFNRSNDAIWGGVTGANVVHFPMFQQYIAAHLKIRPGKWYHHSVNMHVYLNNPKWDRLLDAAIEDKTTPCTVNGHVEMDQLMLQHDIAALVSWVSMSIDKLGKDDLHKFLPTNDWVSKVAFPMMNTYMLHKLNRKDEALKKVGAIRDANWSRACKRWLVRRYA